MSPLALKPTIIQEKGLYQVMVEFTMRFSEG